MVLMKYLRANRSALLFTLIWQLAFFVVGVALVMGINAAVNDDPDYICMGSLMALIAILFGTIGLNGLNGHVRFRLAVSMGETRRSYLLCTPVVTAGVSFVGVMMAWLLYLAEKAMYSAIYPNFVNEMPMEKVFTPVIILGLVALAVVLELVLSALMQRFGSRGFLVIWFAYCGLFLLLPRMVDAYQSGSTSILAKIGGAILTAIITIPVKGWIAIGVIFVLALLTFVVDTFRKAEVKL